MRSNKLNRIRLRADPKKLQGGDNAEPVYFCSGVGASFLMDFSLGFSDLAAIHALACLGSGRWYQSS